MIEHVVDYLVTELNDYFNLRLQIADRVVAGPLFNLDGAVNTPTKDKVAVILVNLEEDRTYRSVETLEKRPDGASEKIRPPVKANLYLLFVANLNDYDEAMKSLALVVSFFQHRPAADYPAVSGLTELEGRMTFELHSMTFEQINHLWGAMGGKYMPSVLYKVGIVDLRDRQIEAEVPPVEDLVIAT